MPARLLPWELVAREASRQYRLTRCPRPKTEQYRLTRGPRPKTEALLPRYAELFAERTAEGRPLPLSEIGARMGVTREWVRVLRKRYFRELPSIRVDRAQFTKTKKAERRSARPSTFRRLVRSWLEAEGYRQCGTCRLVKCDSEMTSTGGAYRGRCKRCSLASAQRNYYERGGNMRNAAWRKANPEKCAAAARRYYEKHPLRDTASANAARCPSCDRLVARNRLQPGYIYLHRRPDKTSCDGWKLPIPQEGE